MLTHLKTQYTLYSHPNWCSWDLFRSFKVCLDTKERVGAESNRKLPHLLIPSKTSTVVPEFAVEDLPLGRSAALVPKFEVKTCPWAEHFGDDDDDDDVRF